MKWEIWAVKGTNLWKLLFKCWDFQVFGGNANGLWDSRVMLCQN